MMFYHQVGNYPSWLLSSIIFSFMQLLRIFQLAFYKILPFPSFFVSYVKLYSGIFTAYRWHCVIRLDSSLQSLIFQKVEVNWGNGSQAQVLQKLVISMGIHRVSQGSLANMRTSGV